MSIWLYIIILKSINYGYLEITSIEGDILKFGNPEHDLKTSLIIKKPNFTYNLIRGGSIGFAECYMRGEFETDDLSNLIELTARNIKVIYKFFINSPIYLCVLSSLKNSN